ncbi:hypothetical protein C8Q76DRAFT_761975 [Earliella scabrosa]|nr:hypothetical protein C8Q76DRAFT_761975 [Earliella scabrosa]
MFRNSYEMTTELRPFSGETMPSGVSRRARGALCPGTHPGALPIPSNDHPHDRPPLCRAHDPTPIHSFPQPAAARRPPPIRKLLPWIASRAVHDQRVGAMSSSHVGIVLVPVVARCSSKRKFPTPKPDAASYELAVRAPAPMLRPPLGSGSRVLIAVREVSRSERGAKPATSDQRSEARTTQPPQGSDLLSLLPRLPLDPAMDRWLLRLRRRPLAAREHRPTLSPLLPAATGSETRVQSRAKSQERARGRLNSETRPKALQP